MAYRRWHAFQQRDGWYYWGREIGGPTPEIVGPFASQRQAQTDADSNRQAWVRGENV